jgi:hypothetical protein
MTFHALHRLLVRSAFVRCRCWYPVRHDVHCAEPEGGPATGGLPDLRWYNSARYRDWCVISVKRLTGKQLTGAEASLHEKCWPCHQPHRVHGTTNAIGIVLERKLGHVPSGRAA